MSLNFIWYPIECQTKVIHCSALGIMSNRLLVLRLYRDLLKEASDFKLYYYKNYFTRKIKLEFRRNKNADEENAKVLIDKAKSSLAMLRRQTSIVNTYSETKLVIE